MKRILSTLVVLLTVLLSVSAQTILMKVTINGEQPVRDKNGNEVVLRGVLELPCDAFTSIEYIVQEQAADERAVDLGLSSGTLWASMNYGAITEKELGTLLEFSSLGLISSDSNWGGYWKAPSKDQAKELIDECDWEPVKENDVLVGYNVFSRENENFIFIPITKGYFRSSDGKGIRTSTSFYWTSDSDGDKGYALTIADGSSSPAINSYATSGSDFFYQMAVRPVWSKEETPVETTVTLTLNRISEPTETGVSYRVTFETNGTVQTCGVQYATSVAGLDNGTKVSGIINGNTATVSLSGLTPGTPYYIRAYAMTKDTNKPFYSSGYDSFQTAEEVVTDYPKAQPVNLGLPSGIKWASWNMGASNSDPYGKLIGWGALSDDLTDSNSSLYAPAIGENASIAGNALYDIATAEWGQDWKIPTVDQWRELENNCRWTLVTETINGISVTGYRVYGSGNYSQNSIFLPCAGSRAGSAKSGVNSDAWYWTSQSRASKTAYSFMLTPGTLDAHVSERSMGFSIRAVYSGTGDPEVPVIDESKQSFGDNTGSPKVGVDLGGSVKWSQWDVGATKYGEKGKFYSWGSTATQSSYSESGYNSDLKNKLGVYIEHLDDNHDVARTLWKRKWRMPTSAEVRQLLAGAQTTWSYDSSYKCNGLKVTKNGKTIFFPACGYYFETTNIYTSSGYFWTNWPYADDDSKSADILEFSSSNLGKVGSTYRYHGLLVRPVWDDSLPYLE